MHPERNVPYRIEIMIPYNYYSPLTGSPHMKRYNDLGYSYKESYNICYTLNQTVPLAIMHILNRDLEAKSH